MTKFIRTLSFLSPNLLLVMKNLFFLFFVLFLQGCAKQRNFSDIPEDKINFDQIERISLNGIPDLSLIHI